MGRWKFLTKNQKKMASKYAFFGSPRFAALVLDGLIKNNFKPIVLITNPDRPVGRKKIITKSRVKEVALKFNSEIKILEPENLKEFDEIKGLDTSTSPLFGIVAAYSKIIPQSLINQFPLGIIGVHPSLLPLFRGPTPIQSAILSGVSKTGVSLYILGPGVDDGAIIAQREISLGSEFAYLELELELANLAVDLLGEVIPKFEKKEIKFLPQNNFEATFTKKFSTAEAFVDELDLEKALNGTDLTTVNMIDRKIRAFNPEPGAWTKKEGRRMKIIKGVVRDGKLILKRIQYEGKKVVDL
jgi:methionyl-tRNA formyltransferase